MYRRIAAGDIDARNKMAEKHFGLVQRVATYYAKRNPLLDMDDMLQEGRIGIIKALTKFDVDSGYRFSTYAAHWVKQHIRLYVLANHSRSMSAGKSDVEAYMLGEMSDEDIRLYDLRCMSNPSLLCPASADGGGSLEEVTDSGEAPVSEVAEGAAGWHMICDAMWSGEVDPVDRAIVCMHYGVLGCRKHSMREITELLGVTVNEIRRAEARCIEKLREMMGEGE